MHVFPRLNYYAFTFLEDKMPRNKNVFPALLVVILVCVACCLGCGKSVHSEICSAACESAGLEYVGSQTEWPSPTKQTHWCVCRFEIPEFKASPKQDTTSPKIETQKPDKTPIGATMVDR